MKNIKITDIAKAAGVSHATVARVIHKNGYVSEENRVKIEQLIQDMGYIPNRAAQSLKGSPSHLLGHLTVFNPNMLFTKISYAVNQAAAQQGFHVLTMSSHPRMNEEEAQINELIGRRVDGVIITSNVFISRELIQRLTALSIPVVMIERTLELPYVERIQVDDLRGSQQAVQHIIAKGHRRIGFVGRQAILPHSDVENMRYQGYLQTCHDSNLELTEDYIRLTHKYSVEAGFQAAEALMSLTTAPSAIFATSDIFIAGVLQCFQKRGIRVPEDVSLVGYDDTLSSLLAPPITSVGLSHEKIGEQAIHLIMRRMDDWNAPAQSVMIETVLIDRLSVKQI